jgi:hypothetical protein
MANSRLCSRLCSRLRARLDRPRVNGQLLPKRIYQHLHPDAQSMRPRRGARGKGRHWKESKSVVCLSLAWVTGLVLGHCMLCTDLLGVGNLARLCELLQLLCRESGQQL